MNHCSRTNCITSRMHFLGPNPCTAPSMCSFYIPGAFARGTYLILGFVVKRIYNSGSWMKQLYPNHQILQVVLFLPLCLMKTTEDANIFLIAVLLLGVVCLPSLCRNFSSWDHRKRNKLILFWAVMEVFAVRYKLGELQRSAISSVVSVEIMDMEEIASLNVRIRVHVYLYICTFAITLESLLKRHHINVIISKQRLYN